MSWYFAYGSNMSNKQMAVRCPQSRRLGPALLTGWCWFIAADGYASVRPNVQSSVEGVLYDVSSSDEAALDLYEEISIGAYKRSELPVQHNHQIYTALIYINTAIGEGLANAQYSRILQEGATDAGLSEAYFTRHISPYLQV